jgi:PAS domain S-box-containing protein
LNPKFLELFHSENADALVGRPVTDFWAPECRGMIAERGRRRSQGLPVPINYEGVAQRDDGSQFPVQVAVTMVDLPDGPINLAFFTDLTELKETQAELKRHQEHLEELVVARTADLHSALADLEHMSYSMVHDMRAPLRAMQGFARLIEAKCPECRQSPAADYLQRICEASNRLDRLITDALNYNKVVRENPPLLPVDLGRLLRGLVHTYPNLQPPAADITVEPTTELVVLGNESLLTQCFGNLLDNAVKFVAPGVHPRIRVWAQSSTLNHQPSTSIYIADNGIGIPKDAQEKIFGMFQRMHHETEYPGTGIGLAIVKKAVERMRGRVGLESEPGRGSVFCVELPKATKAQPQAQDQLSHAA